MIQLDNTNPLIQEQEEKSESLMGHDVPIDWIIGKGILPEKTKREKKYIPTRSRHITVTVQHS
jgi:hypothetical protein